MALRPVDRLLGGYLVFAGAITLVRGGWNKTNVAIMTAYALTGVLVHLFTRLDDNKRLGNLLHSIYPLFLLMPLYTAIGLLNGQLGLDTILLNDSVIQTAEATMFGGQPSYDLIRTYPSVMLSGLLHLAYFSYYAIILSGPPILLLRGSPGGARRVILSTMVAFVACYAVFLLFPVAGPNYAFDNPTGPVRDVWSARLVYAALEGGSAVGTAFPSSHVAASVAVTIASFCAWKTLGKIYIVPCLLLIVATVYAQMHYAVDASVGLVIGIGAGWLGMRWIPR